MEEALEILWTYARREPLDSNGETVVPTINNSIAAIRIIMRLEGWGSEKRKVNSEKRATHNKPASHRRGEWQFAQHNTTNNDSPQSAQPHSAQSQFVQSQNAQPQYTQSDTDNNNDDDNYNYDKHDDEYTEGELPFAPTPAQHQYPQPNISHNNYACLVAPSPSERGWGRGISSPSPAIHSLLLRPRLFTSLITRCWHALPWEKSKS